ncbi:MAG: DUF4402 domain-containing protein [Rhodospirillales bacterium]|nr:DUF4402 domain-containing protein [Rhodospirillales bacterium]
MNKILLPLTAVALCFTAQQAMAATATASTPANARAKIIAPLTVTASTTDELNFGTMLAGERTVTVSPAGVRSATPDKALLVEDNTEKAGKFTVTNSGSAVTGKISLPTSATVSNETKTLDVKNFTSSPAANTDVSFGASTEISVGASLEVKADATEGSYTGTYNITINY